MKCTWPNCLTEDQAKLLCDSIERCGMGLEPLPEHLDLHCEKYGRCDPEIY